MRLVFALYPFLLLLFYPLSLRASSLYNLVVNIDTHKSKVTGRAEFIPDYTGYVTFYTEGLNIVEASPLPLEKTGGSVVISGEKGKPIVIVYEGLFGNSIDERNVVLLDQWYPFVDDLSFYNLTVRLPRGFKAVSEAEAVRSYNEGGYHVFEFGFPYPLEKIHLIASKEFRVKWKQYKGINIYTYFLREEHRLSEDYIEYTRRYIDRYEDVLYKFPYKRLSIVEVNLPVGYSAPTLIVFGKKVLNLPFIVETSLGHEILHQWFGNYIYVNPKGGNWAEGITTYLADHLYEELKGRGWEYRKALLVKYNSYAGGKGEFPLNGFRVPRDNMSRAIGYGKSAMVFHMLIKTVGGRIFYSSLRDLIVEGRFKRVSWDDIRVVFERRYGGDLSWFFKQWLYRVGAPEIGIENVGLKIHKGKFRLTFDVVQKGDVYRLLIPISIYFSDGKGITKLIESSTRSERFTFYLEDEPLRIVVDENYDIFRKLSTDEFPPVISRVLGKEKLYFILPESGESRERCAYIAGFFTGKGKETILKVPEEFSFKEMKSSSFVVCDGENPLVKRLFGKVGFPDAGFSIVVRRNPWNEDEVVAILQGKSKLEAELGFRKLLHLDKYSSLSFNSGENVYSKVEESMRGISIKVRDPVRVLQVSLAGNLESIVNAVKDKKIIYIGERHDQYAHHVAQLNIIKSLYGEGRKVAIGMEMFQKPFQYVIDDYIEGKIDEVEFLRQTEYFKRWGFDYNLYKPIMDFAREKRIPVVALNIDSSVVKKVAQGGIESLAEEERKYLPSQMDFSVKGYRERLKRIFSGHPEVGGNKFEFFLQAQIIWDEYMAESIDGFLRENRDYQMVVLAGSEHVKYGWGIPKRVLRRNGYDYSIILLDEEPDIGIGDYILYPEKIEALGSPELGILVVKEDNGLKVSGFKEESIARSSGLRVGDIIISFDGYPVRDFDDLKIALFYKDRGSVAKVRFLRDGKERVAEIVF